MKKGQLIALVAFVIVTLGLGAFLLIKTKKKEKMLDAGGGSSADNLANVPVNSGILPPSVATPTITPQPSAATGTSFPVKLGDRGEAVEKVQIIINNQGGKNLKEDGIFGPNTLAAVREFFGTDTVTEAQYLAKAQDCDAYSWLSSPILKANCLFNS